MAIAPADVSVVVQGPIVRDAGPKNDTNPTAAVLRSVRAALPGAELILSTWEGADVAGLEFDRVLLNPDPGPWEWLAPMLGANFNRQFVCTQAGMVAAARPYAVKLRSDTVVENAAFLNLLPASPVTYPKVFSERVVVSSYMCFDPRRVSTPYFLGDMFFFGRTADLRFLFGGPPGPYPWLTRPLNPEQVLWLGALNRSNHPTRLRHNTDVSVRNIMRSEQSLFANFVIARPTALGLLLPRRFYLFAERICYSPEKVEQLRQVVARGGLSASRLRYLAEVAYIWLKGQWANRRAGERGRESGEQSASSADRKRGAR